MYNPGIYKITNIVNNKVYIGQSIDVYHRIKCHRSLLKCNHDSKYLQDDYNIYGIDNFKYDIIELCDKLLLNEKEMHWIEYYNSTNSDYGYNILKGGQGKRNYKRTKPKYKNRYSKEKSKETKKYRTKGVNDIILLNTLEIFKGANEASKKYPTADRSSIQKCCKHILLSAGNIEGEKLVWLYYSEYIEKTEEEIEDIINYAKNYICKERYKRVHCIETDEIFESATKACLAYNISVSNLNGHLKGRQKTAGKDKITNEPLHWEYIE